MILSPPKTLTIWKEPPNGNGSGGGALILQENWMLVSQFAKAVGLSPRRILSLCEEGRIKSHRRTSSPKSQHVIPRSEVEKFLRQRDE